MKGKKIISLALCLVFISSQAVAAAGIEVDTSASKAHQPTLEQAPNGVPVINITAPNKQGLSHNKFDTYNVQKQGVILNNANSIANTQLGGYIAHNPNLTAKQAGLILNEVTGTSKTLLQGYTEVAGKAADVIVANPNGISVNGGGFLNTPNATLTTGMPIMSGNLLQGFDVGGGNIVIEGDGFNASNIAKVNLYAKALELNAKLYADKLTVVTGENTIALDGAIAEKNHAGTGVAIDSSLLGGIYANAISLQSTDKGIGVHLPPEVFAQNSLTLTADGDIVVAKAVAGTCLGLTSNNANVHLTNDITANDIAITAQKNISVAENKVVSSLHAMQISAETIDNKGELNALEGTGSSTVSATQQISNEGLIGGYDLDIQAANIDNTGALYSKNNLAITSQFLDNSGVIRSNNTIDLYVENTLTNQEEGVIYSDGALSIAANHAKEKINTINNHGLIQSDGAIYLTAKALNNTADAPTIKQLSSSSTQTISKGGKYDYNVVTTSNKKQIVEIPSDPALILAAGDIHIDVDTLGNYYSLIASDANIVLNANVANNVGKVLVDTTTTVTKQYRREKYCAKRILGHCVDHKHRAGYRGTFTSTDTKKVPISGYGIQAKDSITGNVVTLNNISDQLGDSLDDQALLDALTSLEDLRNNALELQEYVLDLQNSNNSALEITSSANNELDALIANITTEEGLNDFRLDLASFKAELGETIEEERATLLTLEGIVNSIKGLEGADTTSLESTIALLNGNLAASETYLVTFETISTSITDIADLAAKKQMLLDINTAIDDLLTDNATTLTSPEFTTIQNEFETLGNSLNAKINKALDLKENVEYKIITSGEGLYQTNTHNALSQSPNINHTSNSDVTLDNLTLPKGNYGIFLLNKASGHPYLIEANPLFTNYKTFLSSNYMLERLDHRPEDIIKRLGDGMYETQFVRNSVIAQSGNRYLEGYASDLEQYKGLMDNALALQEKLQLAFGITLTKEQVAQLDRNIVWMEERIVGGERVLVPQLYLAANNIAAYGPQIAANTIDLNVRETLLNDGAIMARSHLDITADKLTNKNGALVSGGAMNLSVADELQNLSGTIRSEGDMLIAAGSITSGALTQEKTYNHDRGTQTSTLKGNEAQFIAGGNLTMEARDNITLSNTAVRSDETVLLASHEGDVQVKALGIKEEYAFRLQNGYNKGESLTNASSSIEGRNIGIFGNQIGITASSLSASETIALQATQGVSILAANDLTHQDTQIKSSSGLMGKKVQRDMTHQEKVVQSSLDAKNILITADTESITLESADLKAEETILLDAKKDINIVAKQYREGELHSTTKSSWGGLSQSATMNRTEALNVKEAELRTEALEIILKSGNDIRIIGANVDAASDLRLQAANDILIAAAQEMSQNEQWSKSSSFNLGNMMASISSMGLLESGPIYEMAYNKDLTTSSTAKSSNLTSGKNIVLEANNATLIGSALTAQNNICATTATGDIRILAAEEKSETESVSKSMEVSIASIFQVSEALTPKEGETKVKFAVANATFDDTDISTQSLTHKSSSLTSLDGDIRLVAQQNLLIEGSTLEAEKDAVLIAKTGDVTIKESIDTFSEKSKEKHASAEVSFTVQNEYAEIGSAIKAVVESAEQLKRVKDDYSDFKDQVSTLKSTLAKLKQSYKNKEAGVDYEDIEDLDELIDQIRDNEKYYIAAVVAATADLATKTIAIATQIATAAASSGTWGFSVGLALDMQGSKTQSSADMTQSLSSIITANDITINTNPLESTQVAIQGSTLAARDTLEIATDDLRVTASADMYTAKQDTKDLSGSLSMTMYGGGSGIAGSMGYGENHASQESTSHTNSELLAKNINLTVANDALFEGATVRADDTLNLEVGNDLDIISLRDSASSNSQGFNVGASFSLGNDKGYADNNRAVGARVGDGLGSLGASFGSSAGTTQVKQTVLTSLTGENVHVEAGGNTYLKGALLAAGEVNEEGIFIDNENLAFKTETLTFGNSTNSSFSSSSSFNVGTNIGFGAAKDPKPDTNETTSKVNSSTLSLGNGMGYSSSKVLATLGKGDVQIGDLEHSDDLDRLNRDTEALNKNLYSGSVSTSVDATLDHRLLSEEGRGEIAQEVEIAMEEGEIMLDGTVDVAITGVGGAKDMALSVALLPLLVVERLAVFQDTETLVDYLAKHIEVPAKGFERRWRFSRKADLAVSSLMLGQEVPLVGNFVPSVKGNMDGEVTRWISGGINAETEKISNKRDTYTENVLGRGGSDYNYAPNDRDSATRVAMSLFLGYKSRGLEMADYVVSGTPENSTVLMYSHSGGVSRASLASNYAAIYGIGVRKLAADQGPGFGLYNNIDSLQATYSVGLQEPTSDLGTLLSLGYWSTGNNDHMYVGEGRTGFWGTVLGDPHRQLGNPENLDPNSLEIGNEYGRITYDFLEK